ncbi:MAG: N-acetylglucosamine-6-phosphate deacetylase [Janthinobacterium lividum]
MHQLTGRILSADGWIEGRIRVTAEGRIAAIEPVSTLSDEEKSRTLLPGFIDVHVHGGGGVDVMEGGNAAKRMTSAHARHGTTSLLATTMTAPMADIESVMQDIGRTCRQRGAGEARILGVHLEGPYINPGKLGAQPRFSVAATLGEIDRLGQLAPIRLITLAPEVGKHLGIIRELSRRGVRMQLGHTLGTYEDGVKALEHGASGFTHLFNAMTALHHREPGMVGAALAHAEYAELIPDLLHVHPGAIRTALRAIPRLFCVTDSTSASGMPDGDYKLGSYTVSKCMGGVRLADGTLAGSCLTMDKALRNLVSIGLSLEDASNRLSLFPADYLGQSERGRLAVGAWADIVELDSELNLLNVYVEGEQIVLDA